MPGKGSSIRWMTIRRNRQFNTERVRRAVGRGMPDPANRGAPDPVCGYAGAPAKPSFQKAGVARAVFPFGHVGLTLGLVEWLRVRDGGAVPVPGLRGMAARGRRALAEVNYLAVAIGAMLPDILDKPIGHWLTDLGNGRLVGHSLIFLVSLSLSAHVLARAGNRHWPVAAGLAIGTATHLAFDGMWGIPFTLLWPVLGLRFPALGFEPIGWVTTILTDPFVQVTEAAGAIAMGIVIRRELRRRRGVGPGP